MAGMQPSVFLTTGYPCWKLIYSFDREPWHIIGTECKYLNANYRKTNKPLCPKQTDAVSGSRQTLASSCVVSAQPIRDLWSQSRLPLPQQHLPPQWRKFWKLKATQSGSHM